MKALKITLALVAIVVLTVSVISKNTIVQDETSTYKEYSPKDQLVLKRKKARTISNA